jgi:hypothetical protein
MIPIIKEKDLPCYQCICLAICVRKSRHKLIQCNLFKDYLAYGSYVDYNIRINALYKYLFDR